MTHFASSPLAFAKLDPRLRLEFQSLLESSSRSSVPWLDATLVRLLRRPGKRVRPALVLAAADCGPRPDTARALASATAVELLHQSSVVHDDLMDQSGFRGDVPSVHASAGPAAAVLAGDYLVASGGRVALGVGGDAALALQQAFLAMCDGQARETANRYRLAGTGEYLATIRGKTAALFRAACFLGGHAGGLDARRAAALGEFGDAFGMLFQIVDDLMDVVSTVDLWGKPVEQDARHGIYTMPVLIAARDPVVAGLIGLIGSDPSGDAIEAVYEAARSLAVEPTVAAVFDWAARARAALDPLPPSSARDDLAALPSRYATEALTGRVAPRHRDLIASLVHASAC